MHDWSMTELAALFSRLDEARLVSPNLRKVMGKSLPIFKAVMEAYTEYVEVLAEDRPGCVEVLLQTPKSAYWLGTAVFEGGENNDGEYPLPSGLLGIIGKDAKYAFLWAHDYHRQTGRKWKKTSNAYKAICNSGEYAARYGVDVLEERFEDGEAAIINDPDPQWVAWYDNRLFSNLYLEWNRQHPELPPIDPDEEPDEPDEPED